jgi:hypothetical protein
MPDHVEHRPVELDAFHTVRGVAALKLAQSQEPFLKLSKGMVQLPSYK